MGACNTSVESAEQLLVGGARGAASVPHLVEHGRRGLQVIGKRRQLHGCLATQLGRGSPRSRIEYPAIFELARDGPQSFTDGLRPQAVGRELRRSPTMVSCGGLAASEDRLIRSMFGTPQATDAHDDQHHDSREDHDDEKEPKPVPRRVAGARVEQFLQPLQ
jgi:hypothetical protein